MDESIYLGRAVYFLDTFNPQFPSSGYDHPYFGQILLGAFFFITGYQYLLNPTEPLNFEMIFLVPRIFMGILAIVDTFLIFKIGELRYSRKVGFIAAVLFAVMPLTWLTRWIHLDSLQLPLTLLSILLAILCFRRYIENTSIGNRDIILVLLSGTFLGLSIFTKIPSFTIVPLVGYLVFTQSKRNFKILALWFIPVILIPLVWPLHSIIVGEFNDWLDDINNQMHRNPRPLFIPLMMFLSVNPFLVIFGIVGLIYAVIKKDLLLLLGIIPFLLFMYFINRVVSFHLLWLIVILCISTSRLFADATYYVNKISKNKFLEFIPRAISIILVSGIVLGFVSTISLITQDQSSQYFKAAAFVDRYLKENDAMTSVANNHHNRNITVISDPFFGWVEKYKFHNNNYIPYISLPSKLMIKTEKLVSIVDANFREEIRFGLDLGSRLEKLISAFDTKALAIFQSNSSKNHIDILLSDLERPNKTATDVINILDKANEWKKSRYIEIKRDSTTMNITADTKNATGNTNDNIAYLQTPLNLTERPVFLSLSYLIPPDSTPADFVIEVKDNNNALLWKSSLKDTDGIFQKELLALGNDFSENQIKLDVKIHSEDKSVRTLVFDKFSLIS